MNENVENATAVPPRRKVEVSYVNECLEVSIAATGSVEGTINYFPLPPQQRMKLAMELLGYGSVSAMVSELESLRQQVKELDAANDLQHREWMILNAERIGVVAERDELKDLYLGEARYNNEVAHDGPTV